MFEFYIHCINQNHLFYHCIQSSDAQSLTSIECHFLNVNGCYPQSCSTALWVIFLFPFSIFLTSTWSIILSHWASCSIAAFLQHTSLMFVQMSVSHQYLPCFNNECVKEGWAPAQIKVKLLTVLKAKATKWLIDEHLSHQPDKSLLFDWCRFFYPKAKQPATSSNWQKPRFCGTLRPIKRHF